MYIILSFNKAGIKDKIIVRKGKKEIKINQEIFPDMFYLFKVSFMY